MNRRVFVMSGCGVIFTLRTLAKNFSRRHIEMFLIFLENRFEVSCKLSPKDEMSNLVL